MKTLLKFGIEEIHFLTLHFFYFIFSVSSLFFLNRMDFNLSVVQMVCVFVLYFTRKSLASVHSFKGWVFHGAL